MLIYQGTIDDYVASNLVDVAYVEAINDNAVTLSLESEINLDDIENKKWITGLIDQALVECQESSAKIVL